MTKTNTLLLFLLILLSACNGGSSRGSGKDDPHRYVIKTDVPARPAGQKDVLGLVTPRLDTVRVGFIGLGMRGPGAVQRFTHIPGTKIVALCDLHADRVEETQTILDKAGLPRAADYSGSEEAWKKLCDRDDIDLVYIATDWKRHAEMMIYAMEQGKHVACEVPAAMTLDEIWSVINTAEKTQKHAMQLENCVYDYFELTTLNMAQQGLFGEVLHAEGAYIHNLRDFWGYYEGDWRMQYNKEFRGDVYATHGMGPAAQVLDIHRGDKMNLLVSMDTKPVNIPEYLIEVRGMERDSAYQFANGQHTMTMIRTEKGKTIHIQHDVASPRPYSRMYQVSGTKGFANKYPNQGYALEAEMVDESVTPDHENLNSHSYVSDEVKDALMVKYKHRIHRELEEKAKEVGGHGGMDFIMDYRLVYCLQNGLPLDMDVYDLAEWCSLAELSRISLENNSAPVEVPDFTRGNWNRIQGYKHAFVE
ncbi:Gfo/Idh/MocA family protein [Proteiniphilum sp. UBA1028]|jgi:predicted dehydrogenase|uniref:Gfo/Idh/MocA family protein n=1 Tax=Proteiniphilum sp. UBA1028 TaxID=1947251 RepID=UPI000E81AEF8|nr:Gfo/Idh/MocA family oxidoreductase [Proteiniphilum sp. UBA1028]HBG58924.1 glycosyl hydrolase [Porphyromonadaceae bacterium]